MCWWWRDLTSSFCSLYRSSCHYGEEWCVIGCRIPHTKTFSVISDVSISHQENVLTSKLYEAHIETTPNLSLGLSGKMLSRLENWWGVWHGTQSGHQVARHNSRQPPNSNVNHSHLYQTSTAPNHNRRHLLQRQQWLSARKSPSPRSQIFLPAKLEYKNAALMHSLYFVFQRTEHDCLCRCPDNSSVAIIERWVAGISCHHLPKSSIIEHQNTPDALLWHNICSVQADV